jgi:hypothetical protein
MKEIMGTELEAYHLPHLVLILRMRAASLQIPHKNSLVYSKF